MNIYGKSNALNIVSSMAKSNKLSHSFIIYGEKGTGKKFFSKYLTMLIMCNDLKDGKPCFKCRICRNIINNVHTDVTYAEHSGKLNGFRKETIDEVCRNSVITPNDSSRKVYIFNDADAITVQAQNTLLKTIEEPSDFSYFIFTAQSKNVFLDTVISRSVSIGIVEPTIEECKTALEEMNFEENDIDSAISSLGGNIGNCVSYIKDESFKNIVDLTKSLIDCIINNDEYAFLKSISSVENDRDSFKTMLFLFDKIIRDSIVMKFDENIYSGCYYEGAKKMAETVSLSKCKKIHSTLEEALECINSNVNIKLISAALCGTIC